MGQDSLADAPPGDLDGESRSYTANDKPASQGSITRRALKGHRGDSADVVRMVPADMRSLGVKAGDIVQITGGGGRVVQFRCEQYVTRSHGRPPTRNGVFMVQKARVRLGVRLRDDVEVRPLSRAQKK